MSTPSAAAPRAGSGAGGLRAQLGPLEASVSETLARLDREQVRTRIQRGDYTVWKPAPTEIADRLGWLTIADRMGAALPDIRNVVDGVRADGYTDAYAYAHSYANADTYTDGNSHSYGDRHSNSDADADRNVHAERLYDYHHHRHHRAWHHRYWQPLR